MPVGEDAHEKSKGEQMTPNGHVVREETSDLVADATLSDQPAEADSKPHAPPGPSAPPGATDVKPWKHVVVWFFGVILASLIPFAWASQSSKPGDAGPSIYQLLGSGDLYLISIIILMAGLTEIVLLFRQMNQDLTVALLVIAAIFVVFIDAARYAGASTITASTSLPPPSITYWSLVAFGFSAVHSSICVRLAAGAR